MLSSNSIGAECILKVIFKVRKVNIYGPCDIWTNISETVHAMNNVSMKDIYTKSYMNFQSTS